jgi:hypothetical protein
VETFPCIEGCSKRPSSEAAASERLKRTLCRYVEALSEARTKLAGFFNIPDAEVAELADALDSGSSARKGVRVQIPASAPANVFQSLI